MSLEKRNVRRLVSGGAIGFLAMVGLVYTLSRGGYLAFASGLLFLMIYLNRKLAVAVVVGAVCLFSVAGLGLLPEAAAKRIQTAYEVDSSGDVELRETAAGRMLLNKAAINIIRDHPIAGTGWGCLFTKGRDRFLEAGTSGQHVVHNMYLRIFSTLGILGFVPFMLIFWFSFVEGRRLHRRAPPGYFRYFAAVFLACLAAFAVSNLFGNRMFSGLSAGYFWIMCALVERSLALVSATKVVTESAGTEKSVRDPLDGWMTTQ
jgi:O-antigen ligase